MNENQIEKLQEKTAKPGLKTTEFWLSIAVMAIATMIVPILSAFGIEISTAEVILGVAGPISYIFGVNINKAMISKTLKSEKEIIELPIKEEK